MKVQNQNQRRGYKKYSPKRRPRYKEVRPDMDRTARQLLRHADLLSQYGSAADVLVGRSALVVLPGQGSQHDASMFRPVHKELPQFPKRPQFVLLSAEAANKLVLSVVESYPQHGKLVYNVVDSFDFTLTPVKGGTGETLDASRHVLLTAGNNLLQELVNTADIDDAVKDLVLPQLVVMANGKVVIDEAKLEKLAETIEPAELRPIWMQRRREGAEIMSLDTLFADGELVSDRELSAAFRQRRAYENFEPLLGSRESNPARKVFMAKNPARDVLKEANLPDNWAESATDDGQVETLLAAMRAKLPIPELALYTDLLEGLAEPTKPLDFSNSVNHVPPSAIVRAMRATIPAASAMLKHVTDDELLAAAHNPHEPLIVHAYSKVQLFRTEQLNNLPNYAAGSFFPAAKPQNLELAAE